MAKRAAKKYIAKVQASEAVAGKWAVRIAEEGPEPFHLGTAFMSTSCAEAYAVADFLNGKPELISTYLKHYGIWAKQPK